MQHSKTRRILSISNNSSSRKTQNIFLTTIGVGFQPRGISPSHVYPGRTGRPGNGRFRVIPVFLWKQYSGWKFFGFFPMLSARFLPESTGSWQESTGKDPKIFRTEYCFHVPAISGTFLQDMVTFPHLSCEIRWPESSTWVYPNYANIVPINYRTISFPQSLLKQNDPLFKKLYKNFRHY